MQFRKIREEEPRLGLAPLIDVVFLLLIFFMLTSHFHVASGISIKLPTVAQKSYDGESHKIILVIDRANRIYLKGEKIGLKQVHLKLQHLY